jgi:hypothetical protein
MHSPDKTQALEGSCRCGNVRLTLSHPPHYLVKCNCSICLRLGALWAHYSADSVNIEGHPQNTSDYIWGKATLKTIRCSNCGCATHWEALSPEAGADFGININNFSKGLIESSPVRHFDGAESWTWLD